MPGDSKVIERAENSVANVATEFFIALREQEVVSDTDP